MSEWTMIARFWKRIKCLLWHEWVQTSREHYIAELNYPMSRTSYRCLRCGKTSVRLAARPS